MRSLVRHVLSTAFQEEFSIKMWIFHAAQVDYAQNGVITYDEWLDFRRIIGWKAIASGGLFCFHLFVQIGRSMMFCWGHVISLVHIVFDERVMAALPVLPCLVAG